MGDVKAQLGHTLQHGGWRTRTRYHAFDLVCDSRLQVRGGLDQQVVHHRRCTVMVDAVLCHGLQYQSCIDFAQTHMHTAQHGDGPRKAPAIAVKHGQGPEVARKVGHVPRHRIADRVQVSATVVGDHALGVTGGARGVTHRNRVPLVMRPTQLSHGWVTGQPSFVIHFTQALTRSGVLAVVYINYQHFALVLTAKNAKSFLDGDRELAVGDQHTGFAVFHLPSDQSGVQPRIQSMQHRIHRWHGVMGFEHFGCVGEHHAHGEAALNTSGLQRRGKTGATLTHLRPGIATFAVNHGGQVGVNLCAALKKTDRGKRYKIRRGFV